MAIILDPKTEVQIRQEHGRAVIEGKTAVPFKTFVGLILQRKVQMLFKDSRDEPVIIGSDLLTKLASAPDDSHEDRGKLVLITFVMGVLSGVFAVALVLLALSTAGILPRTLDYTIVIGIFLTTVLIIALMRKLNRVPAKQRLYEKMEGITDLLSR